MRSSTRYTFPTRSVDSHFFYKTICLDVKSFEELCNTLKQYRITCTGVSKYPRLNLTTEQSVTLLNILKPLQASWSNWPVNNNFEPLLLQKTLVSLVLIHSMDPTKLRVSDQCRLH